MVVVAIVAAGYVVARATRVGVTYDEALALYLYGRGDLMAAFDFSAATNHWLTTVGMKASVAVFGMAEWALRLPALLATGLYLAAAATIAVGLRHAVIGAATFVLLVANPYLLDYLSLGRGYALALACELASLGAFVRWMRRPVDTLDTDSRSLPVMFALGVAAVAANLTMLTFLLGLAATAGVRLAAAARRRPSTAAFVMPWRRLGLGAVVAAAFIGAVFAQERVHGDGAFVPVHVRIAGLLPEERDRIDVLWLDPTGRPRFVRPDERGEFAFGPLHAAWETIRVVLPAAADRNLGRLDVQVGDRRFERTPADPGPWQVDEWDGFRWLTSTAPLKWRPDAPHLGRAAAMTAVTVGGLAAVGAVLYGVAATLARRGVNGPALSAIVGGVMAALAFSVAPIYLLLQDDQLFFGGQVGLIADTVGSLVRGTRYDATMAGSDDAAALVTAVLSLAAVAALALSAWSATARESGVAAPAAAMAGLLGVLAVGIELQHRWLETPYPTARTALFLLPPVVLLIGLLADAVALVGRASGRVAAAAVAVLALAAAANGISAANTTHTLDWPADRSTPAAVARIASERADRVRVGVEWIHYPAMRYYADRHRAATGQEIAVISLPGDGRPFDYVLASPAEWKEGSGTKIDPATGVVLWRLGR